MRAAGDRQAVAVQIAVVEQCLHDERNAAGLEQVLGDIAATRLQVGDVGGLLEDLGDREQVEVDAALMGDGRQMQAGIGRATRCRNHRRGILQRLAGDDVARPDVARHQFHHLLASGHAEPVTDLVGRRRAGRIRQRQSDRLGDHGHRVGGELAPAGAGGGTGDLLERLQVLVRHLADRMKADRLEDIDDGDIPALEGAGQDRPAIDEDRGNVQPAHRHHHARQRLVAAGHADQRVVAVAAHGELDRVGDHLARRQRRLHPLVAHGDAVGHRDRAEFARRAVCCRNTLLDRLGLPHQRDVAGRRFVPAGGNADERLVDLFRGQPHRIVVGPMRRALRSFRHMAAGQLLLVDNTRFHNNPSPRVARRGIAPNSTQNRAFP